jgi:hypothetical protein
MLRTALHQLLVDKLECQEPACHHRQLMAGTRQNEVQVGRREFQFADCADS